MTFLRRSTLITLGILLTLFVVACGGTASAAPNKAKSNTVNATVQGTQATPATGTQAANSTNNSDQQMARTNTSTQAKDVQASDRQMANSNTSAQSTTAQTSSRQTAHSNASTQTGNAHDNSQAQNDNSSAADDSNQANGQDSSQSDMQSGGSDSNLVVATRTVNVNGQQLMILTTFDGHALYQRSSDPMQGSTCTGTCARTWPPLVTNGNVITASPIKGTLTTQTTVNGQQVEFNGHALYTYSGDTASGQATGQGMDSVWQVVTVNPAAQHW